MGSRKREHEHEDAGNGTAAVSYTHLVYADGVELELGRAYVLREGSDATIVACGVEVEQALKAAQMLAAEGVEVEVIDAFSVKPLDEDTVLALSLIHI